MKRISDNTVKWSVILIVIVVIAAGVILYLMLSKNNNNKVDDTSYLPRPDQFYGVDSQGFVVKSNIDGEWEKFEFKSGAYTISIRCSYVYLSTKKLNEYPDDGQIQKTYLGYFDTTETPESIGSTYTTFIDGENVYYVGIGGQDKNACIIRESDTVYTSYVDSTSSLRVYSGTDQIYSNETGIGSNIDFLEMKNTSPDVIISYLTANSDTKFILSDQNNQQKTFDKSDYRSFIFPLEYTPSSMFFGIHYTPDDAGGANFRFKSNEYSYVLFTKKYRDIFDFISSESSYKVIYTTKNPIIWYLVDPVRYGWVYVAEKDDSGKVLLQYKQLEEDPTAGVFAPIELDANSTYNFSPNTVYGYNSEIYIMTDLGDIHKYSSKDGGFIWSGDGNPYIKRKSSDDIIINFSLANSYLTSMTSIKDYEAKYVYLNPDDIPIVSS